MNLLVTGGNGFVMTNFLRHWLESHPSSQVVVLDKAPSDDARNCFLGDLMDRVETHCVDLSKPRTWTDIAALSGTDTIVHGAAVTPHPYTDATGNIRDPEREDPGEVIDVNIGGTRAILDFARGQGRVQRFLNVSSCAVYGKTTSLRPDGRYSENDIPQPETLYGITKYASELITRRYAALYGLSAVSVRLGPIFGPLDRPGADRNVQDVPNRIAHLALARQPLRVHAFDGVGDWLYAGDAAVALSALANADNLEHDLYTLSSGSAHTVRDLIDSAADILPITAKSADDGPANIQCDPDRRFGDWMGYSNDRARKAFGWSPRSLRDAFHDYIQWLASTPPYTSHEGNRS